MKEGWKSFAIKPRFKYLFKDICDILIIDGHAYHIVLVLTHCNMTYSQFFIECSCYKINQSLIIMIRYNINRF